MLGAKLPRQELITLFAMIRLLLNLYVFIIIVHTVLSFLPQLAEHPIVINVRKIAEFSLKPVRQYLPKEWTIDVSPVVVILAIQLIKILW
jgi:YggT family protein